MPPPPDKNHPIVRKIAASWRSLTGGRQVRDPQRATLVACSGGADSSALLIALAAASPGSITAAHIVHDMRPEAQAHADRDAVRELAARLEVPVVESAIRARAPKANYEARARRMRYEALAALARQAGICCIATAHHADDQLETVLMRLMRGAGPGGLSGIPRRRLVDHLVPPVHLVRPMLGITRADARAICEHAGWAWREDPTNLDPSRRRSAIRDRVAPVLRELQPSVAARAVAAADLCRGAWAVIDQNASAILQSARWDSNRCLMDRHALRAAPRAIASQAVRRAAIRIAGPASADRLPQRSVNAAIRAIRDTSGERREFRWRGVSVTVHGDRVRIEPTG